jgi:hypothetical protein
MTLETSKTEMMICRNFFSVRPTSFAAAFHASIVAFARSWLIVGPVFIRVDGRRRWREDLLWIPLELIVPNAVCRTPRCRTSLSSDRASKISPCSRGSAKIWFSSSLFQSVPSPVISCKPAQVAR